MARTANNLDTIVKAPVGRKRRQSVSGFRNRLTVKNKEPGYTYRWVSDVEERVENMKEIGYEVVMSGDVQVGDRRNDVGSQVGSAVSISAGGGVRQILMRQREEFYKEDQEAKQEYINAMEQAMHKQDGLTGEVKVGRGRPEDY